MRITYTHLAGLTPPEKGAVLRFSGFDSDALYRVMNEAELDQDGSFTIEIERVDDGGAA